MSTTASEDRSISSRIRSQPSGVAPTRPAGCAYSIDMVWPGWRIVGSGDHDLRQEPFSDRPRYLMSRYFVWLTPVSNLMLFSVIGLAAAADCSTRPRALNERLDPVGAGTSASWLSPMCVS